MSIDTHTHKLLVILGPTASGKSDLAVKIAKKFNGEVVSVDSRQVYKGMDIGSGKITKKEMRGVPHHLLDVASPKRRFTVAQFQKLAWKAIKGIWKRGKLPILCGGTGLYIQSIVDGLVIPAVPPNAKLRAELEKLSTEELFKKLKKLDSHRAKNIDKHNRRRLIRALEIVIKTGKPMPLLQTTCPSAIPALFVTPAQAGVQKVITEKYNRLDPRFRGDDNSIDILQLGIALPKDQLTKRIRKRLYKRLRQGMVAEVRRLRKSGLSWKRLEEFGLEYRAIAQYLQKKITRQQMVDKIQKESKQYAKRQMTWFSAHGGSASGGKRDKGIHWIKNVKKAEIIVKKFIKK